MFEKNKLKKLLIAALLFAGACSFAPDPQNPELPLNALYKKQWLEAVTNKVFSGEPNLWGGGAFGIQDFAFDSEGNLHNQSRNFGGWYSTHRIILFHRGIRATVMWYNSAGPNPTQKAHIYSLEVKNNKLYRTQNIGNKVALGWTTFEAWDKETYSPQYLDVIGTLNSSIAYPALKVPDPNS